MEEPLSPSQVEQWKALIGSAVVVSYLRSVQGKEVLFHAYGVLEAIGMNSIRISKDSGYVFRIPKTRLIQVNERTWYGGDEFY